MERKRGRTDEDDGKGGGGGPRVVIHLDLDCFYAQVEQRRLKIKAEEPVAVQQWGSLLAVNYAARKFGVLRGDFADDARKKCPGIHLPHVDTLGENRKPGALFDRTHQKAILRRYRIASREIFAILDSMAPVVEKASIDEAFMDVTEQAKARLAQTTVFSSDFCADPANKDTKVFGVSPTKDENEKQSESQDEAKETFAGFPLTHEERLLCVGATLAREIRQAVYNKLGYTCSTGIASNKLLAKLASPLNKPNGQMLVVPRFVPELMKSLPLCKVRGLGGKLGKQLQAVYVALDPLGPQDSTRAPALASPEQEKELHGLTAHAFLQRCSLTQLAKHVGQDTAIFVHQICQGDDGGEPVQEKKLQVKIISSVKKFDERSGAALTRVEQLEYWVRLLCEEMVLRCEDERLEHKRFPSQLALQFTRAKPEDKPRAFKLSIAQDTTVDGLFAAAMNVLRLYLDSLFPCALLSMHAKNFVALASRSATTISTFFQKGSVDVASTDRAAKRMEEDIKQFAATVATSVGPSSRKKGKRSISAFFQPAGNTVTAVGTTAKAEAAAVPSRTTADASFCGVCNRSITETPEEHSDFHFALELSREQRLEAGGTSTTASASRKKRKGPLDAFLAE